MAENVGVIICAAGSSSRFGGKRKKQFTDISGRAAFLRSIEFFAERSDVKQILLAIPAEEFSRDFTHFNASESWISVEKTEFPRKAEGLFSVRYSGRMAGVL